MKVKQIYVGYVKCGQLDKIILVKESSKVKKMLKTSLNCVDDEFKCVFTKTLFFLKRNELIPLLFFLDENQMEENIGLDELKELYQDKEEVMYEQFTKKPKIIKGFRNY